jgi:5'-3' exoribonuclease 1
MRRLSIHFKYFIRVKIQNDKRWQKFNVIFSGAEARVCIAPAYDCQVPGEGEHKIMDFIRNRQTGFVTVIDDLYQSRG